jgi:hypothetical protein
VSADWKAAKEELRHAADRAQVSDLNKQVGGSTARNLSALWGWRST